MHPFLRTPKQVLIAGLLWSPLCLWVITLLHIMADLTWVQAVILALPPMAIKFFICLSTWYVCKTANFKQSRATKVIATHSISAIILNALWLLLILLYSRVLDIVLKTDTWHRLYLEAVPVFLAMGVSLYFIAILGHYLILAVEKNREAEQEVLEQRLLASQAELKALKTTVNPHFLFNSLNLLGPLMRTSTSKAETVVAQLSDFLLYNLRYGKKEMVTVREELEHITDYLGIEGIRLGNRLKLELDVDDDALGIRIPTLSLLPLVENAIKHGIGQCLDGGTLTISIKKDANLLQIEIRNPYEPPTRPIKGEGMGLHTLKRRFAVHYGGSAQLNTWKDKNNFKVNLSFPVN